MTKMNNNVKKNVLSCDIKENPGSFPSSRPTNPSKVHVANSKQLTKKQMDTGENKTPR